MKFKIGDIVYPKNQEDPEMIVNGFLEEGGQSLTNVSDRPTVWAVCKYRIKDGTYKSEVFHEDALEAHDTE